jgi:hypothetical protein
MNGTVPIARVGEPIWQTCSFGAAALYSTGLPYLASRRPVSGSVTQGAKQIVHPCLCHFPILLGGT